MFEGLQKEEITSTFLEYFQFAGDASSVANRNSMITHILAAMMEIAAMNTHLIFSASLKDVYVYIIPGWSLLSDLVHTKAQMRQTRYLALFFKPIISFLRARFFLI
jgi:hypothetical protein